MEPCHLLQKLILLPVLWYGSYRICTLGTLDPVHRDWRSFHIFCTGRICWCCVAIRRRHTRDVCTGLRQRLCVGRYATSVYREGCVLLNLQEITIRISNCKWCACGKGRLWRCMVMRCCAEWLRGVGSSSDARKLSGLYRSGFLHRHRRKISSFWQEKFLCYWGKNVLVPPGDPRCDLLFCKNFITAFGHQFAPCASCRLGAPAPGWLRYGAVIASRLRGFSFSGIFTAALFAIAGILRW